MEPGSGLSLDPRPGLGRSKADGGPGFSLGRFLFTVLRRAVAHQRIKQVLGDVCDLVDSLCEGFLVSLRRLGGATDLAHILKGGGLNFG